MISAHNQNYLHPLKLPESSIVDTQTVDDIFFMVPEILDIHEKFFNELGKRLDTWDQNQKIGDSYYEIVSETFVKIFDQFHSYASLFSVLKSFSFGNIYSFCE